MTPQRSDSEQPRTANDNTGDSLRDGMAAAYNRGLADGRAEAGAASLSEPLQRLHRAVAGLPVHMGHGAIRAIEVLELIEAEQRAALAAPSQEPDHDCLMPSACGVTGFYCANSREERASEPAGLDALENFAESGYCPRCKVGIDLHPLDAEGIDVGHCPSPREAVDALYARLTASAAAQERP